MSGCQHTDNRAPSEMVTVSTSAEHVSSPRMSLSFSDNSIPLFLRYEMVEAAAGGINLFGASLPINKTGPQVSDGGLATLM